MGDAGVVRPKFGGGRRTAPTVANGLSADKGTVCSRGVFATNASGESYIRDEDEEVLMPSNMEWTVWMR